MSSAFSPNNSGAFFRQCTHEAPFFCGFPASLLPDTGYTRKVLVAVKLCGLLPPYSLFQVKDLLPHVPNSQKRWSCPCVLQGFLQILSLITPWTLLGHGVERKTPGTDTYLRDIVLNLKTNHCEAGWLLPGYLLLKLFLPQKIFELLHEVTTFWSLHSVSVTFLPLIRNVPKS